MTQRLRRESTLTVISIYISQTIGADDLFLVEDLLLKIYDQRGPVGNEFDSQLRSPLAEYHEAYRTGQPITHRIRLLQSLVHSKILSLPRAFLVVDGFDWLPRAVQLSIEQILEHLSSKLCVFITRRVPRLMRILGHSCDKCPFWSQAPPLNLYWLCQSCEEPHMEFTLFYRCKSRTDVCEICGGTSFAEPYRFINWNLRTADTALLDYVRKNASEMKLRDHDQERLCSRVKHEAEGNITLARLRLDNMIKKSRSLRFSSDSVSDRLPSSIVSFF